MIIGDADHAALSFTRHHPWTYNPTLTSPSGDAVENSLVSAIKVSKN
jgi:hypothetical protein